MPDVEQEKTLSEAFEAFAFRVGDAAMLKASAAMAGDGHRPVALLVIERWVAEFGAGVFGRFYVLRSGRTGDQLQYAEGELCPYAPSYPGPKEILDALDALGKQAAG